MSNYIEVVAVVEGKTEQIFIESVLKPYLADRHIYIYATQVTKPGQKGGDVKFERVKRDLETHLKQRNETYVTTLVDYYGIREWPGIEGVGPNASPAQISEIVNTATKQKVVELFAEQQAARRFIPYVAIHEFEALLFSDEAILAAALDIPIENIAAVLGECGEPEAVNNSPQTAPSKRLDAWSARKKFPKTSTGIAIAKEIGVAKMREKCPQFNAWIAQFEVIVGELGIEESDKTI